MSRRRGDNLRSRLAPDLIARLLPLLQSIARLEGRRISVSQDQAVLLLVAAGVDPSGDVAAELALWSQFLESARDTDDDSLRLTVTEALVLRGVPEGNATEAVREVVSGVENPSRSGRNSDATRAGRSAMMTLSRKGHQCPADRTMTRRTTTDNGLTLSIWKYFRPSSPGYCTFRATVLFQGRHKHQLVDFFVQRR
jgi:hypothetical protein